MHLAAPSCARALRVPALLAFAALASLAACSDSTTAPTAGSLIVPAVTGLPQGAQASLTLTGPDGASRAITAPDTIGDLDAGTYTIAAAEVLAGVDRYRAVPSTQQVQVGGGAAARARTVAYQVATGRIAVRVLGLPTGANASVTITGAGGFTRSLTGSDTVPTLAPGSYTVAATEVAAAGRTWLPWIQAPTADVAAGGTASVTVDYGAGSATLVVTVLDVPDGIGEPVTVTGPGGYVRAFAGPTSLRHLEPGSYTITAATVYADLAAHAPSVATQTVTLADGETRSATSIDYASTPLVLGVELVAQGLAVPVLATAPEGDARLFVVERNGRVRIVANGQVNATPFLDITNRVNFAGERGLLGMAFEPAYATTGRFYVYYVALDGAVVIERFESTPGSDVAGASAGIVIRIPHGGGEHHGGTLAFGPDGMLYLAPGDGRCCGDPDANAQNTQRLLGKMLRIDVRGTPTYTVPAGNPFVGTSARPEIWALGLRSPWRFSFDAPTGLLYLADVGQDAHEEVNVVPATATARNYGWPIMEGLSCYRPSSGCSTAELTLPVLDYPHTEGCSVTGGFVYRGTRIPELVGHYLYADYCQGWLRSFRYVGGAATERRQWANVNVPLALSFGRDGMGELYVISGNGGRVWRIVRR